MFLVNSRLGRFSAAPVSLSRERDAPTGAPLVPKLRGNFAEFLSKSSLERLWILSSPTCVSLWYGHRWDLLGAFLVETDDHFTTKWVRHHPWGVWMSRIYLGPPRRLERTLLPAR